MEAAAAQSFAAMALGEAGTFEWNHFTHRDTGLGDLHGDDVTVVHGYVTFYILFANSRPEAAGVAILPCVPLLPFMISTPQWRALPHLP